MTSDDESPSEWCKRTFSIGIAQDDPCKHWRVQFRPSVKARRWVLLMDILRPRSPTVLEAAINYAAAVSPIPHVRVAAWRHGAQRQEKTRAWEPPKFEAQHYAYLANGSRVRLNPELPSRALALKATPEDPQVLVILASHQPSPGAPADLADQKLPGHYRRPAVHSPSVLPPFLATPTGGSQRHEGLEQILRFGRGAWAAGFRGLVQNLSGEQRELLIEVLDEAQWVLLAALVGDDHSGVPTPDAMTARDEPPRGPGLRLDRPADLILHPDLLKRLEVHLEPEAHEQLCSRLRAAARLFERMLGNATGREPSDDDAPSADDDDR